MDSGIGPAAAVERQLRGASVSFSDLLDVLEKPAQAGKSHALGS